MIFRTVTSASYILCGALSCLFLTCAGVPTGLEPVTDFDVERYTGKWYEIARLDHSFERGLSRVTAEYSKSDSGDILVVNRGFDEKKKKWKAIEGRAVFVGSSRVGSLKVSFFGPFYGSYIIFELDKDDYEYAFVCGSKTSYLWLLSRTPEVDEKLLANFINKAKELGFETENLIYVDHK